MKESVDIQSQNYMINITLTNMLSQKDSLHIKNSLNQNKSYHYMIWTLLKSGRVLQDGNLLRGLFLQ